jgi:hypothetical protein
MEAQMKLNPQQKQQVQRVVIAGMKVMFSPQSHQLVLKTLQGPGSIDQKLGQGIAGLMGLLLQEAKGSIPAPLVIPAALILLAHAVDFLNKAGQQVPPQAIGSAVKILISLILKAGKMDPDKVMANAQAHPGTGAPAAPMAPPQPPQGVMQ